VRKVGLLGSQLRLFGGEVHACLLKPRYCLGHSRLGVLHVGVLRALLQLLQRDARLVYADL
jgi:hypothetical protein